MADLTDTGIDGELRVYFTDAQVRAGEYGAHYVALWEALEQQSATLACFELDTAELPDALRAELGELARRAAGRVR